MIVLLQFCHVELTDVPLVDINCVLWYGDVVKFIEWLDLITDLLWTEPCDSSEIWDYYKHPFIDTLITILPKFYENCYQAGFVKMFFVWLSCCEVDRMRAFRLMALNRWLINFVYVKDILYSWNKPNYVFFMTSCLLDHTSDNGFSCLWGPKKQQHVYSSGAQKRTLPHIHITIATLHLEDSDI